MCSEIGCFDLLSVWIGSGEKWMANRCTGLIGIFRAVALELWDEAGVGIASRTGRENDSFADLVLTIVHFHWRTVSIDPKCVPYPRHLLWKFADTLKEFHSEYQWTDPPDSVINDLLCSLYHVAIYLSLLPSINQSILLFSNAFKNMLQAAMNTFAVHCYPR